MKARCPEYTADPEWFDKYFLLHMQELKDIQNEETRKRRAFLEAMFDLCNVQSDYMQQKLLLEAAGLEKEYEKVSEENEGRVGELLKRAPNVLGFKS